MSKVSSPPILNKESMPDAPEGEWLDRILDYGNGFNDQVAKALRNGVTLADNTPYKTQSYILKHGVETEITPPLAKGLSCAGVSVLQCDGIEVDSTTLKPTGKVYPLGQGSPILWRPSGKPSGSIYVTAKYDLKNTDLFARLGKTGTQSIGNIGNGTAVQWDSNSISSDGIISIVSNSRITVSEAGLYLLTGNLEYAANAVGIRAQFFSYNGATTFTQPDGTRGYSQIPNGGGSGVSTASSAMFVMSAGSYVEMFGYQNSGGGLNITSFSQCQVSRFRNDSLPFGRLNLLFYGE